MKRSFWLIIVALFLAAGVIFSDNSKNPRIILAGHLLEKGNYYYNGGSYDTEKAAKYFRWSIIFDPDGPYAHYQLARIYLVWNDLESAKKEIDRELSVNPQNRRAYYVRGLIDGYLKDYDEAARDFQKFIEFRPDEWAGYMDLSWIYISSNQFEKAVEISSQGLEKHPENVWLLSNKGLALYKLGDYGGAEGVLKKAKELAEDLKEGEWVAAYPGNDPKGAGDGILDLKGAISYNLALTYRNQGDRSKYGREAGYYQSLFEADDPRAKKILDTL